MSEAAVYHQPLNICQNGFTEATDGLMVKPFWTGMLGAWCALIMPNDGLCIRKNLAK